MEMSAGRVVRSKAGRDKGYFLAVVQIAENGVYVADGKERPLEKPKRKNPKHLEPTRYVLSDAETATNRSLKRALTRFSGSEKGR